MSVLYGDATDPELLGQLRLERAEGAGWTVPAAGSGYPMNDPRHALMRSLSDLGFRGRVAVAVHRDGQREALERAGAHLVLTPFEDAAQQAADRIVLADAAEREQDENGRSAAGALG